MFKHMLPNAMVATLTMLPFIVTGTIASLAALDFLGFGLPSSAPSLGELTLQAKQNIQAPWLGFTAFFTFAIMLALLVLFLKVFGMHLIPERLSNDIYSQCERYFLCVFCKMD